MLKRIVMKLYRLYFLCLPVLFSCQREISLTTPDSTAIKLVGSPNSCSNITPTGNYKKGVALTSSNQLLVSVAASSAGDWSASTTAMNGISFSGKGNLVGTGTQTITLQGAGTPSQAGVFSFVITVGSSTCSFTLKVDSSSAPGGNIPPVANAGADISATSTTSTISLNGSGTDADGIVASYAWTKIAGPASFTIVTPNQPQTQVTGLTQGTYQFELKVTDNLGATGKDTVQVTVAASTAAAGTFASEQEIFGTVTPIGYSAQYDAAGKIVKLNSTYLAPLTITYNAAGKIATIGIWFTSGNGTFFNDLTDSLIYDASGNVIRMDETDNIQHKTFTLQQFTYNADGTPKTRKIFNDNGSVMDDFEYLYTNGNLTGLIQNASHPNPGDTTVVTYDTRANNFKNIYPQFYFLDVQTVHDQTYRSEIYFFSKNYPTKFGSDVINVTVNSANQKPFEIYFGGSLWYRYFYN